MGWELDFIKWLQASGSELTDYVLYFFTQFGTELLFMAAVIIVYWCIDKREGFRLVNLFMVSQLLVGLIKVGVRRTRPYHYDGVRAIMEETSGYSFPSGHSNNIAVVGTDLAMMTYRKRRQSFFYVLIAAIALTLLVMLSRIYLGQHFLTDVITGCVLGIAVALIGSKIFDLFGTREEIIAYIAISVSVILFAATIVIYILKGVEFESGMVIAGTYLAASIGYVLEKKFVRYELKAERKSKYVLRVLLGTAVALIIKEGLKAIFNLFALGVWSLVLTEFLRYFIIGIWVTLLAPMVFKRLKI